MRLLDTFSCYIATVDRQKEQFHLLHEYDPAEVEVPNQQWAKASFLLPLTSNVELCLLLILEKTQLSNQKVEWSLDASGTQDGGTFNLCSLVVFGQHLRQCIAGRFRTVDVGIEDWRHAVQSHAAPSNNRNENFHIGVHRMQPHHLDLKLKLNGKCSAKFDFVPILTGAEEARQIFVGHSLSWNELFLGQQQEKKTTSPPLQQVAGTSSRLQKGKAKTIDVKEVGANATQATTAQDNEEGRQSAIAWRKEYAQRVASLKRRLHELQYESEHMLLVNREKAIKRAEQTFQRAREKAEREFDSNMLKIRSDYVEEEHKLQKYQNRLDWVKRMYKTEFGNDEEKQNVITVIDDSDLSDVNNSADEASQTTSSEGEMQASDDMQAIDKVHGTHSRRDCRRDVSA